MERRARETRTGRGGWLATLGGALLLVLVGFAVGLVAGAAFEEPDLMIEQLAGHGTEVPLDFAEASAASPTQDIAPGERAILEAAPAIALPEVSAPAATPPPVPSVPRGSGFSVQVGAFGDRVTADRLASRLAETRLPVYVADAGGSGAVRFRVRVGPVASEREARRLAQGIVSEHGLPTWVLREEGR